MIHETVHEVNYTQKAFVDDFLAGRTQWLFSNLNKLKPEIPLDEVRIRKMVQDYIHNSFMIEKVNNHNITLQAFLNSQKCLDSAKEFIVTLLVKNFKEDAEKALIALIFIDTAIKREEDKFDKFIREQYFSGISFIEIVKIYVLFQLTGGGVE